MYELRTGGDSNLNPESDVYNENTGIGTEWNNLSIQNAPITQEDLDVLQTEIDANTANIATPYGMITSNNALDPSDNIDITEGVRRDSTQTQNIFVSATTKATDAAFALGSGQGGMPSGLLPKSSEYYRVFAIKNSTTGTTDIGFDTSDAAINLLADANAIESGFDLYRQIMTIRADSASAFEITSYKQYKDRVVWNDIVGDIAVPVGSTATLHPVQAAPDSIAILNIKSNLGASEVNYYGLATSTASTDQTPSSDLFTVFAFVDAGDFQFSQSLETQLPVDQSSEIRLRLNVANSMGVFSLGFISDIGL
jgi:hypothetical protein